MRLPAADFRTASAFAAAATASRRSWSGLCLDRAARLHDRSGVGRARPVSTPSAEAAWLGVVVQRPATSSPTLSASRPPFPIGRLNIEVCCVYLFHHHPARRFRRPGPRYRPGTDEAVGSAAARNVSDVRYPSSKSDSLTVKASTPSKRHASSVTISPAGRISARCGRM